MLDHIIPPITISSITSATSLVDAAQAYVLAGLAVVQLHHMIDGANGARCSCGSGEPEHHRRQGGKHPVHASWQSAPLRSLDAVRALWAQRPMANIGIATGAASAVWVLDVDPDNGGNVALAALVATHGPLPETPIVATGSGGWHHYFSMPADGTDITNARGSLPPGLDVRGTGGQVVAPPSVSGKGMYRWAR